MWSVVHPFLTKAATLLNRGCNPMYAVVHPYQTKAATLLNRGCGPYAALCDKGCNLVPPTALSHAAAAVGVAEGQGERVHGLYAGLVSSK